MVGFPLVQTLTISLFSKLLSRGGVGRQGAMLGLLSSSGSVARIVSPVVTGILLDAGDLSNDNDWDDFGNGYHCVIWGLGLSLIGLYGSIHFVVKTKVCCWWRWLKRAGMTRALLRLRLAKDGAMAPFRLCAGG